VTYYISGMVGDRNFKFCMLIDHQGRYRKNAELGQMGSEEVT